MTPQTGSKLTYDLDSITRNVPPSPGVFSLFSRSERVYVGEAEDVCAGLLELYFEDNPYAPASASRCS
jgi:excinuclease UvrABC nuclease subunit